MVSYTGAPEVQINFSGNMEEELSQIFGFKPQIILTHYKEISSNFL